MSSTVELGLGCFLLSSAITYAWWSRLRVWCLRQDLFDIRDRLWDEMRLAGQLDHPAHRRERSQLNALIWMAPALSFFVIARVLLEGTHRTQPPVIETPETSRASNDALARMARYLLRETATGILISMMASIFQISTPAYEQMVKWLRRVAESTEIQETSQQMARVERRLEVAGVG